MTLASIDKCLVALRREYLDQIGAPARTRRDLHRITNRRSPKSSRVQACERAKKGGGRAKKSPSDIYFTSELQDHMVIIIYNFWFLRFD